MAKIFDGVSLINQGKLLKLFGAHTFTFNRHNTILNTFKKDNIIGIIIEGAIDIVHNDYNGDKIIVESLDDGDIFGSMLLPISNDDYEIITKEDAKIAIIDYKDIVNNNYYNYSYYHQFMMNFLDIISQKTKEKNERILILSKKTIRNKLLEYFNIRTKGRITKTIYLPYTYIDLAIYLGVDRTAMYRELKNLQNEGLIEIKNKKITLKY